MNGRTSERTSCPTRQQAEETLYMDTAQTQGVADAPRAMDSCDADGAEEMRALARHIPSLDRAEGLTSWPPDVFDDWGATHPDETTRHDAALLLEMYNHYDPWRLGDFRLGQACMVWSPGSIRAAGEALIEYANQHAPAEVAPA